MKPIRKSIAIIAAAAVTLIVSAADSFAVNRTLILLQERSSNPTHVPITFPEQQTSFDQLAAALAVANIYNTYVPDGEAAKLQSLANGRYQRFVNFAEAQCTRANLLNELIRQSRDGYVVDLAIFGGGDVETLKLWDGNLTGDSVVTTHLFTGQDLTVRIPGNIRSLLTDARAREGASFNFKLRLVRMSNSFSSTTNDDWLAIGAKAAVGCPLKNWMQEPLSSFFWEDFLNKDMRVRQAADDALARTRPVWSAVPGYTTVQANGMTRLQETQQVVSGNTNLIFKDECQLALNESRSFIVRANQVHTFPGIYLVAGQQYTYTASGTWSSGQASPTGLHLPIVTDANGYFPVTADEAISRRNIAPMMCLIGERFPHNNSKTSPVSGSAFGIGQALIMATAAGHGFLDLYANDILEAYGNNTGQVTVSIRRVR